MYLSRDEEGNFNKTSRYWNCAEMYQGWHIARDKQYGTRSVLFKSENLAVKHSMTPCKNQQEHYVSLPHGDKRAARARILRIPSRLDMPKLLGYIIKQESDTILTEVAKSTREDWSKFDQKIFLQTIPESVKWISDHICLQNKTVIHIVTEGKRPYCLACGEITHLQVFCPLPIKGSESEVSTAAYIAGMGTTTKTSSGKTTSNNKWDTIRDIDQLREKGGKFSHFRPPKNIDMNKSHRPPHTQPQTPSPSSNKDEGKTKFPHLKQRENTEENPKA